mmetsp:Transcript_7445/g.20649  ORF Transcript_7445/g.20649 Transcript_7445/m.20649 type:complete len:207 (+) Transcript_7445:358-978(+)
MCQRRSTVATWSPSWRSWENLSATCHPRLSRRLAAPFSPPSQDAGWSLVAVWAGRTTGAQVCATPRSSTPPCAIACWRPARQGGGWYASSSAPRSNCKGTLRLSAKTSRAWQARCRMWRSSSPAPQKMEAGQHWTLRGSSGRGASACNGPQSSPGPPCQRVASGATSHNGASAVMRASGKSQPSTSSSACRAPLWPLGPWLVSHLR